MDGCPICLSEFETNYALIPDLDCNCIYAVHDECWEKWNYTCIYCRTYTIHNTIEDLVEVYSRLQQRKNRVRALVAIVFYILYFTFVKIAKAYGFSQILP